MDATGIATLLAGRMIAHRDKLQVDMRATQHLHDTLSQAAHELTTSRESQGKDAKALLEHWKSDTAHRFEAKSQALDKEMHTVSTAGTKAAAIIEGLAQSVSTAHRATQSLIDEYTRRAAQLLRGAQAVKGAGGQSSVLSSFANVIDLANSYGKESAKTLSATSGTVQEAKKQLTALTARLRDEHIAMPNVSPVSAQHHGPRNHGPQHHAPQPHGAQNHPHKPGNNTTASRIISAARHEIGYHEHGDNIDKFGPPGQPWCSYFATAMWRKSGVNIPNYGFTGDVYTWGERHHLAYNSHQLNQARPGDVLLFGTSSSSPTTSTHIAIVESVHGNTVDTIEGNEGNAVRRETHTLSSSTFYGGVHP